MFSKTLAEKKLEELTGGFIINKHFANLLKENGLTIKDGEKIKKQLKNEIKTGVVSIDGLSIRLMYLIRKASQKNNIISENYPPNTTGNVTTPIYHPFKKYETQLNKLKEEYDEKKEKVIILIEKAFAPPQITYDRFIDSVQKSNKIFQTQYQSATNIINLASEGTPRMKTELERKISTLKSIISHIDDLTNELIINLSSDKKTSDEVDLLFDDMDELIKSIKKYE